MKKYTFNELENMNVVELVQLAQSYGLSPRMLHLFTYAQLIAYVHAHQLTAGVK